MAGSSYGTIFRITTWGESHGAGVGVVIDGCPAGLPLSEEDIQKYAYENYNVLPTIDQLYQDDELVDEHEEITKFYPQFASTHPRPQIADYSECRLPPVKTERRVTHRAPHRPVYKRRLACLSKIPVR